MHAKDAARSHGREELTQFPIEVGGAALADGKHLAKHVVGQEADTVGEQAEEQPHEKMRGFFRINSPDFEIGRELGKLGGGGLGDAREDCAGWSR